MWCDADYVIMVCKTSSTASNFVAAVIMYIYQARSLVSLVMGMTLETKCCAGALPGIFKQIVQYSGIAKCRPEWACALPS